MLNLPAVVLPRMDNILDPWEGARGFWGRLGGKKSHQTLARVFSEGQSAGGRDWLKPTQELVMVKYAY